MNNVSKLGYSRSSPYRREKMNQIGGSTIDMTQTDQPIVGTDGEEATIMQPGSTHQFNGPVTETTLQSLEEMEPDLLEAHLSTLSDEDQEEFVEKYVQLDENMRMTALTQMFKKHKDKVKMQAGGFTYTPSSDFLPDGYVLTDVITNSPDKTNTVKPGKPQSESLPKYGKPTQRKQIKAKPVPAAPVAKPVQAAPLTNKVTEGRITLPTVTIRPEPQVSETSKLVGYASGNLPYGWARNLPTQQDFDNILVPGSVVGEAKVKEYDDSTALLEDKTGSQFFFKGNKAVKLGPQNAKFFPGPPNLNQYDLKKGANIPSEITSRFKPELFNSPAFELFTDPVTGTTLLRDKKSGKYFKQK